MKRSSPLLLAGLLICILSLAGFWYSPASGRALAQGTPTAADPPAATLTPEPTLPPWLPPTPTVPNETPTPEPTLPAWLRQPPSPSPGPPPTALSGFPQGFYPLDSAPAVELFRKDYPNGTPDFVQVIDLSQGASLRLMHGQITEPRPEKGVYGGADPRMTSLALQTYWQQAAAAAPATFCVTNGTFFYMPEYPTRLAFPLKVGGQLVTDGWGIDTYVDQKLILELWSDRADIRDLTQENLVGSQAPDLVGGLNEEANKRAKFAVGRTFVGLDDRDGDGRLETVMIFNTQTARQSGAADILRQFGADKVMMLDGGGSTQLMCRSGWHIRSDRPIPQAIAIIAGRLPPLDTRLVSQPEWPVLLSGENLTLTLRIENTGAITWTQATTSLRLDTGHLGDEVVLPVPGETSPGEIMTIAYNLPAFSQPGIYPVSVQWSIEQAGQSHLGEVVVFRALVIPPELAEKRSQLQRLAGEWATGSPEQALALFETWLNEQAPPTPTPAQPTALPAPTEQLQLHLSDLVLIPVLMAPVLLLLGWVLVRLNRRE